MHHSVYQDTGQQSEKAVLLQYMDRKHFAKIMRIFLLPVLEEVCMML
jgi:hypothetical protein